MEYCLVVLLSGIKRSAGKPSSSGFAGVSLTHRSLPSGAPPNQVLNVIELVGCPAGVPSRFRSERGRACRPDAARPTSECRAASIRCCRWRSETRRRTILLAAIVIANTGKQIRRSHSTTLPLRFCAMIFGRAPLDNVTVLHCRPSRSGTSRRSICSMSAVRLASAAVNSRVASLAVL